MFQSFDLKKKENILEFEDAIDRMEDRLNRYMVDLTNQELSDQDSRTITYQMKLIVEFERIGDYAINVLELAEQLHQKGVKLSDKAIEELHAFSDAVSEIIGLALDCVKGNDSHLATRVEPLEEIVDKMEDTLKFRHIERLKNGQCTIDGGLVFLELLTNLERISDHCSNIAVYVIGYQHQLDTLDRHEYIKQMHEGADGEYSRIYKEYNEKYFSRI